MLNICLEASYGYFSRSGYANTDWFWFILCIIAMLFSLIASTSVKGTYKRFSKQYSEKGISGARAARLVLDAHGLNYVAIHNTGGKELSDYFSPKQNAIFLSDAVYTGTSTADIGVACHEAGHAVQHAEHYVPLTIRNAIIPATNFANRLAIPLIIIGILLTGMAEVFIYVAYIGVFCYAFAVVFQLLTLPTEFNASSRALKAIKNQNILSPEEVKGARKVLRAAAMTYVAALAVSLTQLLRLMALVGGRRRR